MLSAETRNVIIVPGLDNSGPAHWQTWLETRRPNTTRVVQRDWSRADLDAWSAPIRRAIDASAAPPLIVAHSYGVLASVQAARRGAQRIGAALLVAPADPALFGCERALTRLPLPFPTILVASRNDTWLSFEAAKAWSQRWGARLVDAGHAGHINVKSGHGPWPAVLQLIHDLERATEPTLVHTSD